MFFAPPQVKSLSRYSQFGIYLQPKHFLMMVGLAICVHALIIGFYAMVPREEVIKIPVRVMNIKFGDGGGRVVQMSSPVMAPPPGARVVESSSAQPVRPKPEIKPETPHVATSTKTVQNMVDKAFAQHTHPAAPLHPAVSAETITHNLAAESTLATPKQYVRESSSGSTAGRGKSRSNGRSMAGTPEGDAIIERYEQTISLWMAQHKTYPDQARQQGIEGDAVVRIRINREGRVIYNSIDRSSGNAMIDNAVLNMVRASDPVPVVPDDYPDGSQLEFLIPVSFRLQ